MLVTNTRGGPKKVPTYNAARTCVRVMRALAIAEDRTLRSLAEEVEVSEHTIRRCVKTLVEVFPDDIEYVTGVGGRGGTTKSRVKWTRNMERYADLDR